MALIDLFTPDEHDLAPHYPNRAEHAADGWVHGVGFGAALIGGGVLLALALGRGGVPLATGAALYALCLMAMLAASAVYNLTRPSRARRLLRRLDEAAIFLMIAGSYTPFTTQRLEGAWAVGMTAAVWIIALLGAAGKLFLPGVSRLRWLPVYALLGWMVVAAFDPLMHSLPPVALALLIIGGAVYTLGIAIYVTGRLPYRRAIWHGFVLAAAGSHYAAVVTGVVFA
jgi:hemolysin III